MKRVLQLAKKGIGKVSPNPLVGALIVKNNVILTEGYHRFFGGPHAEINVLSHASSKDIQNSTLYVNLEPCTHHGKTPPCTERIIRSGIKKVIIGMTDPNPLVNGRGIRQLMEAGIEVKTGILKEACERINAPFIKAVTQKQPFVTVKIAQTLDGQIACQTGGSQWITSEASRKLVHRLRKEHDAVLVGIKTVLKDDPELTVRLVPGKGGKRIVLDSKLRIPLQSRLLHHPDPQNTIVVTNMDVDSVKQQKLEEMGVQVWNLKKDKFHRVSWKTLAEKMVTENLISILVEGGSTVFSTFLKWQAVDRLIIFIAPKLFGQGIPAIQDLGIRSPDQGLTFKDFLWRKSGPDMVFEGWF
jgi:diaminohydroxyphosphoribosylaminopyrimidine deaminase/5-amino-6-(5-phosphoribosylamino)uracil reductase